jgi:Male sterility protein
VHLLDALLRRTKAIVYCLVRTKATAQSSTDEPLSAAAARLWTVFTDTYQLQCVASVWNERVVLLTGSLGARVGVGVCWCVCALMCIAILLHKFCSFSLFFSLSLFSSLCFCVGCSQDQLHCLVVFVALQNVACSPLLLWSVYPFCAPLGEQRFGLTQSIWDQLVRTVDTIYHCGAHVQTLWNYERLRAANVTGTLTVLELATCSRVKLVHFISTTSVVLPCQGVQGMWLHRCTSTQHNTHTCVHQLLHLAHCFSGCSVLIMCRASWIPCPPPPPGRHGCRVHGR